MCRRQNHSGSFEPRDEVMIGQCLVPISACPMYITGYQQIDKLRLRRDIGCLSLGFKVSFTCNENLILVSSTLTFKPQWAAVDSGSRLSTLSHKVCLHPSYLRSVSHVNFTFLFRLNTQRLSHFELHPEQLQTNPQIRCVSACHSSRLKSL